MNSDLRRRLQQKGDLAKVFPRIHFVGVGGTGMSGLAEVMSTLGYDVSGSDMADNPVTQRLSRIGVNVFKGHAAANVLGTDCVVVSSAIKEDNAELMEARAQRIPVVPRAEMLAELMRFKRGIAVAGTHGKTTTTSLAASVLGEGGIDPTFVIGGKLLAAGANARLGKGDWLVAEADESDGSFLRLNPQIAIVTNIDEDHLENYNNDFLQVQAAFNEFLHRLPFYGLAILCTDNEVVAKLAETTSRHVITYGVNAQADVRAENVRQEGNIMHFTLCLPDQTRTPIALAIPGIHNVQNALAAAAVAWQLGVSLEAIQKGLGEFAGVGRRFNTLGDFETTNGAMVKVVDDYAHHPKELEAVLAAARGGWPDRRLVVAFQPHRYSRTRDLFDDFASVLSSVDVLLLTEVYAAGEQPIAGAGSKDLARAIRARGRIEPIVVNTAKDLKGALNDLLLQGDLVLMVGAGDIGASAAVIGQDCFKGGDK